LKQFGKKGADAVIAELHQAYYRDVFQPRCKDDLSPEQQKRALQYLMYLKQKRCGRIKARGCADGRKQRLYKTKEETSSPTVSTEAVFLTLIIDAREKWKVVTLIFLEHSCMHTWMKLCMFDWMGLWLSC
jgi:hypothetical protein